jgi:hypothetical protein
MATLHPEHVFLLEAERLARIQLMILSKAGAREASLKPPLSPRKIWPYEAALHASSNVYGQKQRRSFAKRASSGRACTAEKYSGRGKPGDEECRGETRGV